MGSCEGHRHRDTRRADGQRADGAVMPAKAEQLLCKRESIGVVVRPNGNMHEFGKHGRERHVGPVEPVAQATDAVLDDVPLSCAVVWR
ncbi:hypothetical protein A9K66_21120 [Mesorhizobium sp. AA23]|nr:hypothetical protein A9K66_21120 [Mesorhizobium sp. AA23]